MVHTTSWVCSPNSWAADFYKVLDACRLLGRCDRSHGCSCLDDDAKQVMADAIGFPEWDDIPPKFREKMLSFWELGWNEAGEDAAAADGVDWV